MAKSTLQYTRQQIAVINHAWFALMSSAEKSSLQEKRLKATFRSESKEFGPISAKALIMSMVYHGMREVGPEFLANLSFERDEKVICFMVGVYLRGKAEAHHVQAMIKTLEGAQAAWTEAHNSYLESI